MLCELQVLPSSVKRENFHIILGRDRRRNVLSGLLNHVCSKQVVLSLSQEDVRRVNVSTGDLKRAESGGAFSRRMPTNKSYG